MSTTPAEKTLAQLIKYFPHRWEKAKRDANTRAWFAERIAEATFMVDGVLRETTISEERSAFTAASAVVEARLKEESAR